MTGLLPPEVGSCIGQYLYTLYTVYAQLAKRLGFWGAGPMHEAAPRAIVRHSGGRYRSYVYVTTCNAYSSSQVSSEEVD